MHQRRTVLGLKLMAAGPLSVLCAPLIQDGDVVLTLASLLIGAGLLACFTGAQGRARWGIFGALSLSAISSSTIALAANHVAYPGGPDRQTIESWRTFALVLLAASLCSFLAYVYATCQEIKTPAPRLVFWLLGTNVLAVALLFLGSRAGIVPAAMLFNVLTYTGIPFCVVLVGLLALLSRDISRSVSFAAQQAATPHI